MKWLYGDAWEKFPIEPGEEWGLENGSRVAVHDIFEPLPKFMHRADLIFVDPPWSLGNLNTFYTKAERTDHRASFNEFADVLWQRIAEINPQTLYIEMGNQNVESFYAKMQVRYWSVQRWSVTYYRKHPTWILRGSRKPIGKDFTGMDEAKVIECVAQMEDYRTAGDLCMGRGLVGLAAYRVGKPFVGTELNKRRLAVLLQKLSEQGAVIQNYGESK